MLRVFTVYRHLPNRDYRKRAIAATSLFEALNQQIDTLLIDLL